MKSVSNCNKNFVHIEVPISQVRDFINSSSVYLRNPYFWFGAKYWTLWKLQTILKPTETKLGKKHEKIAVIPFFWRLLGDNC